MGLPCTQTPIFTVSLSSSHSGLLSLPSFGRWGAGGGEEGRWLRGRTFFPFLGRDREERGHQAKVRPAARLRFGAIIPGTGAGAAAGRARHTQARKRL